MASARDEAACRKSGQSGFTLIELAMVMVIIAVVVGALTPSVVRQLSHARTNRAATVVAADFYHAQSVAGRQRSPVAMTFDAVARTMTLTAPATGATLAVRRFGPGSDFGLTIFTASPASVLVLPTGMASGSVTVTVGDASYTRRVLLTRAGMIRIK
jgi:prepilin-type N-terminal cleavage/methylation domain-containing protein